MRPATTSLEVAKRNSFYAGQFCVVLLFVDFVLVVLHVILISVTKFQIRTEPEKGTFFE